MSKHVSNRAIQSKLTFIFQEEGVIEQLAEWVEDIVSKNIPNSQKCSELVPYLRDCYPIEFLDNCYFTVTPNIPKPNISSDDKNIQAFLEQDDDGITYKNIYFVKPSAVNDFALHVHELVHVAQWSILGVNGFIERYLNELNEYSYNAAPLEKMAYEIDNKFRNSQETFDILSIIRKGI